MADGWAVTVAIPVLDGRADEVSNRVFYAHLPDRSAAEEAVKQQIGATQEIEVLAVELVPHGTFVEMNIDEGGVVDWAPVASVNKGVR